MNPGNAFFEFGLPDGPAALTLPATPLPRIPQTSNLRRTSYYGVHQQPTLSPLSNATRTTAMGVPSGNAKSAWSRRQRLFAVLILIFLIAAYNGWQFARQYQIESEVLDGYKNDNRELVVVLSKELENEPQHWNWGRAKLISETLADRLRQR